MLAFSIDDGLCTRCGQCVSDCPMRVLEQTGKDVPSVAPDRVSLCIQCQHCLAICPIGALSILGKNPADSQPIGRNSFPSFESMDRFVRGRRSIRRYRTENVPKATIEQLLATLAHAPTGVNACRLTFHVVSERAAMDRLRQRVYHALREAFDAGSVPETLQFLKGIVAGYIDHGVDIIFRGAPAALIVSTPPDTHCADEDVVIAVSYFELLAQSSGLGTVWWGFLRRLLQAVPHLKPVFGLAEGHLYSAILFGWPDVHYARTVQRDDAATVRMLTID